MKTIFRGLLASTVAVSAAIGTSASAAAEPLAGTYTATVIDSADTGGFGPPPVGPGDTFTWVLNPCGPDCTHLEVPDQPKHAMDLVAQGGAWAGGPNALGCSKTIDPGAATATETCQFWIIHWGLAKVG